MYICVSFIVFKPINTQTGNAHTKKGWKHQKKNKKHHD